MKRSLVYVLVAGVAVFCVGYFFRQPEPGEVKPYAEAISLSSETTQTVINSPSLPLSPKHINQNPVVENVQHEIHIKGNNQTVDIKQDVEETVFASTYHLSALGQDSETQDLIYDGNLRATLDNLWQDFNGDEVQAESLLAKNLNAYLSEPAAKDAVDIMRRYFYYNAAFNTYESEVSNSLGSSAMSSEELYALQMKTLDKKEAMQKEYFGKENASRLFYDENKFFRLHVEAEQISRDPTLTDIEKIELMEIYRDEFQLYYEGMSRNVL